jgi:hypothetical protein
MNFKKRLFVFLLLPLVFAYCEKQESLDRDVFMGLKLGSTQKIAEKKIQDLVTQGTFKVHEFKFPYFVNKIDHSSEYYSLPLYFSQPGDSVITEIKVMFFDDRQWIRSVVNSGLEGSIFFNLKSSSNSNEKLTSRVIFSDIVNSLNGKYGQFDEESDQLDFFDNSIQIRNLYWNNRKGVNIKLIYIIDKENIESYAGDSQISISYTYTDDLMKKLNLRNSIY